MEAIHLPPVEVDQIGPTFTIPLERGFWTYVHRDAADVALYVGCTTNPLSRTANHVQNQRKSHWFGRVATIQWSRWSTEWDMRTSERRLIHQLRPAHNVLGVAA